MAKSTAVILTEIKKDIEHVVERIDNIDSNMAKMSGEVGRRVLVTDYKEFVGHVEKIYATKGEIRPLQTWFKVVGMAVVGGIATAVLGTVLK